MKSTVALIFTISSIAYAMDNNQHEYHLVDNAEVITPYDTIVGLIRSADADALQDYLRANSSTLTTQVFSKEPYLIDIAQEKVSNTVRGKNLSRYIIGVFGTSAGSIATALTFNHAQTYQCHDVSGSLGVGIMSGMILGMGIISLVSVKGNLSKNSPERRIVRLLKATYEQIADPAGADAEV